MADASLPDRVEAAAVRTVRVGPELAHRAWLICPDCGTPVHPDPLYKRSHIEFYRLNPSTTHAPKGEDQKRNVERAHGKWIRNG